MNETLVDIIKKELFGSDNYAVYDIYRKLENYIPQLNDKTKIEYFRGNDRYIHLSTSRTAPILIGGDLIPKRGLMNAIKRALAPIYKWFVDHKAHEADRAKNWRPFNLGGVGCEYSPKLPTYAIHERKIELKHLAWFIKDFDKELRMMSVSEFGFIYGYDGLEDVLYISKVYKEIRSGLLPRINSFNQVYHE